MASPVPFLDVEAIRNADSAVPCISARGASSGSDVEPGPQKPGRSTAPTTAPTTVASSASSSFSSSSASEPENNKITRGIGASEFRTQLLSSFSARDEPDDSEVGYWKKRAEELEVQLADKEQELDACRETAIIAREDLEERFAKEKEDMTESFRVTTSILMDRLKELEARSDNLSESADSRPGTSAGERPQTALSVRQFTRMRHDKLPVRANAITNSVDEGFTSSTGFSERFSATGKSSVSSASIPGTGTQNVLNLEEADDDADEDPRVPGSPAAQQQKDAAAGSATIGAFHDAARKGLIAKLEELQAKHTELADSVCPKTGDSLLHACAGVSSDQRQALLNFALGHGVDMEIVNRKGETALHRAVQAGSLALVKALVELGADYDVPVKDEIGYTPLMLACREDKLLRICKFLVEAKADLHHKAGNESAGLVTTAMAVAQKHKTFETMVFLASSGASLR